MSSELEEFKALGFGACFAQANTAVSAAISTSAVVRLSGMTISSTTFGHTLAQAEVATSVRELPSLEGCLKPPQIGKIMAKYL